MPSATFFHLPPAKRKRLLTCAMEEFARVSYPEASINRMIQAADISRGSFYLYFSDKQDLFAYLMALYLRQFAGLLRALLEENGGNLLRAFSALFDRLQNQLRPQSRNRELTLALEVIRQNAGMVHSAVFGGLRTDELLGQILACIDTGQLRGKSREDQEDTVRILLHVACPLLYEGLVAEDPAPVRAHYQNCLRILAQGIAADAPTSQS